MGTSVALEYTNLNRKDIIASLEALARIETRDENWGLADTEIEEVRIAVRSLRDALSEK